MQVKLNGCLAQLLAILLFPIVTVINLFHKKPVYVNTIEEHPLAYAGERPLVIALWASWASVWACTEEVIEQMKIEFAGKCEFCYVEVTGNDVRKQYKLENEPTVLVRHKGREIARLVNLMDADELRAVLAKIC